MTGGAHILRGGFWNVAAAVQPSGTPRLALVTSAKGQLTISWSPALPGFVLQQTPTLGPPAWVNLTTGEATPVIVWVTGRMCYYRLHKP